MRFFSRHQSRVSFALVMTLAFTTGSSCLGHGTVVFPASRVHRVYQHLIGQGPELPARN